LSRRPTARAVQGEPFSDEQLSRTQGNFDVDQTAVSPERLASDVVGKGRARDAGPIESEHAAVARIVELRRADCSYPEIATALDAEGHKPRPAASVGSVVGTSLRGRSLAERGQEALHPSGEHLVASVR
jgi:hypothetical protein